MENMLDNEIGISELLFQLDGPLNQDSENFFEFTVGSSYTNQEINNNNTKILFPKQNSKKKRKLNEISESDDDELPKSDRIKQACANCSKSHLKCDGGDPCERCVNKNVKCFYTTPEKRGRKPKNLVAPIQIPQIEQNNVLPPIQTPQIEQNNVLPPIQTPQILENQFKQQQHFFHSLLLSNIKQTESNLMIYLHQLKCMDNESYQKILENLKNKLNKF